MGDFKNCADCRRLFLKTYYSICPECMKKEEDNFAIIREFLRNLGRKSTVDEIVEQTKVEKKYVTRMMENGRLLSEYNIEYACAMCGKLITSGKLCEKCTGKIDKQIVSNEQVAARGPQVHVKK